jgi:uncharacterized damage-inducible protein DinB
MTLQEMLLAQLESEGAKTRRAIEAVPDGHEDFQPHEKSMPFGRLTMLVAGMPSWFSMIVEQDSLDLQPPGGGSNYTPPPMRTREERRNAVDDGIAKARESLKKTSEAHLMKPWRLMVAGNVVDEHPRHVVLRDTFGHLAHHRGQLTVYLRMVGAKVPAIYGPSADEQRFD